MRGARLLDAQRLAVLPIHVPFVIDGAGAVGACREPPRARVDGVVPGTARETANAVQSVAVVACHRQCGRIVSDVVTRSPCVVRDRKLLTLIKGGYG